MPVDNLDPALNRLPRGFALGPGVHVHLIGVGGVAMASLAGLLSETGCQVTGSDLDIYPPASCMLGSIGLEPMRGYGPETLAGPPDLAVVGNVVTRAFPVLEELNRLKIPYLSLPQTLELFFLCDTCNLVVAGCHGKTSLTNMLALLLTKGRLPSGRFIGGASLDLPKPWRAAPPGGFMAIEGDEYDCAFFDKNPKFLHYRPNVVVLTSVEFDHADIYPNPQSIKEAYLRLMALMPPNGLVIYNGDDQEVTNVALTAACHRLSYGLGPDLDLTVSEVAPKGLSVAFRLSGSALTRLPRLSAEILAPLQNISRQRPIVEQSASFGQDASLWNGREALDSAGDGTKASGDKKISSSDSAARPGLKKLQLSPLEAGPGKARGRRKKSAEEAGAPERLESQPESRPEQKFMDQREEKRKDKPDDKREDRREDKRVKNSVCSLVSCQSPSFCQAVGLEEALAESADKNREDGQSLSSAASGRSAAAKAVSKTSETASSCGSRGRRDNPRPTRRSENPGQLGRKANAFSVADGAGGSPKNGPINAPKNDHMIEPVVELTGLDLRLPKPGLYNATNAAAAVAAFLAVGGDARTAVEVLSELRGVRRRQQVLLDHNGITLIDDFAHHPTAVDKTLSALRSGFPGRRILAAFEPRSNTSRRALFQEAYAKSLRQANLVFLSAVDNPDKAPEGDRLDVEKLALETGQASVHDSPADLASAIMAEVKSGDLIVLMSNGGFGGLARLLREELEAFLDEGSFADSWLCGCSRRQEPSSAVWTVRTGGPTGEAGGYKFKNVALLESALTHRSIIGSIRCGKDACDSGKSICVGSSAGGEAVSAADAERDNQRLEFLGDSVLNLAIAELLFRHQPRRNEGDMTRQRASLVCESRLAEVARALDLGFRVVMSPGEESSGGRERPSVLADAMEAVLGAVYLDGGHQEALKMIERLWGSYLDGSFPKIIDHKSRLQELSQKLKLGQPVYAMADVSGPSHNQTFTMSVEIDGLKTSASGATKKMAGQRAARQLFQALEEKYPDSAE